MTGEGLDDVEKVHVMEEVTGGKHPKTLLLHVQTCEGRTLLHELLLLYFHVCFPSAPGGL